MNGDVKLGLGKEETERMGPWGPQRGIQSSIAQRRSSKERIVLKKWWVDFDL